MGIGESVVRQDQKIARCQTTVILILKGKHIWYKRKGSEEESAPDTVGFFPLDCCLQRNSKGVFNTSAV